MNQTCPQRHELVDYLLGKLSDELLDELENHFLDCRSCEETLRGLDLADTLNKWVGEAASSDQPTSTDEDFVAMLIRRMQEQTSLHAKLDPLAKERAAEVIRLLDTESSDSNFGKLGLYRLDELLGVGSSGVVFRALDEQLNRPVALKVLRPSLGEAAKERFMIEARAAASVDHPNVVTIYQVGQLDGLAFIAMQWLPGQTLECALNDVTFFSEQDVRDIAQQIASGLQAAHQKTLIHRDIKPANIWLSESNQVKLLDFGLARIADDDPHMTSTGMLAGTPYFMSPEQSRGHELDCRSDLFSLGCVMYRAATGKLPFGEKGILATLQSIQNHHPDPPRKLNPGLSVDFSDLTMCLLEKQPANRPESAACVSNALVSNRSKWKFNAVGYEIGSPASQPVKVQSGSFFGSWIAAIVLVGLLSWGWYSFGEQIIRIATNQGQIVIETNDAEIEIEVLSGGEVVRVIDTRTEQTLDIKSGEYQIRAGKEGNDNGFEIQPAKLIMTRGDKRIVTITRSISTASEALSSAGNAPLFDGKTFEQWMDQLSNERSLTAFQQGVQALGTLSQDEPDNQKRAIELMRPLVRTHGSHMMGRTLHPWVGIFNTFFSHVSPQQVVEFAIEELKNGTSESRYYATLLLILGTIYEDRVEQQQAHLDEVHRRLDEIFRAGISQMEELKPDSNEGVSTRTALGAAFETTRRSRNGFQFDYGGEVKENVQSMLEKYLASSHSAEVSAFIASLLVGAEAESRLAINEFAQNLDESNVPADLRNNMVFNYLALVPNEDFNQVVPGLFEIIGNDERTDELIPGYSRTLRSGEALKIKQQSRSFTRKQIRNHLLNLIGNRRKNANAALPYLKELESRSPSHSSFARTIALRIRGADAAGLGALGGGGAAGMDDLGGGRGGGAGGPRRGASGGGRGGPPGGRQSGSPADSPGDPGGGGRSVPGRTGADEAGLNHNDGKPSRNDERSNANSQLFGAGGDPEAGVPSKRRRNPSTAKTFEGKTGQEWIKILETELSHDVTRQSLNAISTLSRFDPTLIERSLSAARARIRMGVHSLLERSSSGQNRLNFDSYIAYFGLMSQKQFLEFLKAELKTGNSNSLEFFGSLANSERMPHMNTIQENAGELVDTLLQSNQISPSSFRLVEKFVSLTSNPDPRAGELNFNVPSNKVIQAIEKFLGRDKAIRSFKRPAFDLCRQIIAAGGKSDLLASYVADQLVTNSGYR